VPEGQAVLPHGGEGEAEVAAELLRRVGQRPDIRPQGRQDSLAIGEDRRGGLVQQQRLPLQEGDPLVPVYARPED